MTQLQELAKPFPDRFIHSNPSGGGDYVSHPMITQKLLAVLNGFEFDLVEALRGHVAEIPPNPNGKSDRAKRGAPALENAVVGVVCRFTCEIDGHRYSITEVGDCEQPHNWPHDGARLKDAMSDALKRCAMRLGVGLHLWAQRDGYFLPEALARKDSQPGSAVSGSTAAAAPQHEEEAGGAPEGSVAPPRRQPPKPPEGWRDKRDKS